MDVLSWVWGRVYQYPYSPNQFRPGSYSNGHHHPSVPSWHSLSPSDWELAVELEPPAGPALVHTGLSVPRPRVVTFNSVLLGWRCFFFFLRRLPSSGELAPVESAGATKSGSGFGRSLGSRGVWDGKWLRLMMAIHWPEYGPEIVFKGGTRQVTSPNVTTAHAAPTGHSMTRSASRSRQPPFAYKRRCQPRALNRVTG